MERRQFGRRQTNLRGWIAIRGRPKIQCIVRNLTPAGALLELEVPSWLPFEFELAIEPDDKLVTCQLRHKLSNAIGVMFCEPSSRDSQREKPAGVPEEWMGGKQQTTSRPTAKIK